MSIFGHYFVGSLVRRAGWPRKLGLFRGEGIATAVTDPYIDLMVDWAFSRSPSPLICQRAGRA